ncbi:AAA family ATPase [Sutcliffiella deserti]|uniref:AAA family ATPase n=1 Tax=Sutcliffiella deserti TaxID=2875501 RepID=UPI001CBA845B|nr:SMC family ATPase [Sutcliffiella deserti]
MKPIELTVGGLHSFREKQVIDFEALCQGGVFGIFGPTGSGKSSILDAMTLALYGKVERASNNTQGIMNHAENVVEVSYIFELENAKGKQRYKVERTFKRTDPIRVKSGICRLTEIKEEENLVLADKAGEVNAAIQEIIGLTIDDFTRAVVLPQGKFAEFLSLKGADRRQMLQRLFQLEKYGDELSRKIKDELQQKTRKLAEIHAEQLGLGDASDTAVKEAASQYKAIAETVEKSEKALQQLERIFEEKKRKWEWQSERKQVERSLLHYKENESEIKQLEVNIALGEQAEVLKPILLDLTEIESTLKRWTVKHKEDIKRFESAKEKLKEAKAVYETAKKEKETNHPVLLSKKEKLERALRLEEGMKAHQNKLTQYDVALTANNKQLSIAKQQEKQILEIYEKAISKQKSLKDQLAQKTQAQDHLEKLQSAYDKKQEVKLLEKNLAETNKETQKLQEKVQLYKRENLKAENELATVKKEIIVYFNHTEKYYTKAAELTLQLDWLGSQVDLFLQEEKRLAEDLKLHQLALELAKSLKEGEACPVCGSTHHPSQPVHESMSEIASSREQNGMEKLISSVQQEKQENVTIKLKLEQLASEIFREINKEQSVPNPTPSTEKVDQWEKEYHQSKEKPALLIEKYHLIETEQKALVQDYIHIQEKKLEFNQTLKTWETRLNESEKLMQSYEDQWSTWNARLSETRAELEEKQSLWKSDFPEITYESIEEDFYNAKEVEKQKKELQERINTSVDFIERKEKELKRAQELLLAEEKVIFQNNLEREQVCSRIEETKAEIKNITEENSVVEGLKTLGKELTKLHEQETKSYQDWTEAQNHFHETDKNLKQSEHMLDETTSRQESLGDRWNLALEKTSFSSKDEVEQAINFIGHKDGWKEKVKNYWETLKSMENDWNRLNSLIGQEVLEQSDWLELQERLNDKRQKLREEIEAKSASFQHLSSIKDRNERYRALEEHKEKLSSEIQQYQKLQAVFKGNGFVEYLAEEQLLQISRDASERLGHLTRQRYALEMDSQGGFIIRDDANGGVRRPVSSLSGGETFLTSLALALSLSAQIQLRGEYPLQFFFLDEGFGTLDHELLDGVVTALEKLQSNHLAVGVISHVQELRARLPRRLMVTPAQSSGKGSVVTLEDL